MRMLEQAFNFHGVMPRTVTFRFQEQDIQAEQEEAEVKKTRAETRKIQIESLEISPVIARQIAADDGDLKPEYLEAVGEGDVTPEETGEGYEGSEAMYLWVGSLAAALKDMETQRTTQRSVEEIAADITVVEQTILKRNRKDRPTVIRKVMASGRTEDYKIVYENGKIIRLERMI